jgi:hypothetical protein
MTSMTPTPLPIELWNIILTFTPHTVAKQFIYLAIVHKIFNPNELGELKQKYIYDYLIGSSPLNKHIYNIYNKLSTIDTKYKYITNYSHIFQMVCTLKREYIINGLILKNYLLNKITNEKDKVKFEHITNTIYINRNEFNRHYTQMLKNL